MKTTPKDATHWSVRAMAASQNVTPQPCSGFGRSTNCSPIAWKPSNSVTTRNLLGKCAILWGSISTHRTGRSSSAWMRKSQIQALDRTQPILPLRPGLPARQTHDYERHGTTTLFAALNVLEGTVIAACQPKHRHQEFLRFLNRIDKSVDSGRKFISCSIITERINTRRWRSGWRRVLAITFISRPPVLRGSIRLNAGLLKSHENEFAAVHFTAHVT